MTHDQVPTSAATPPSEAPRRCAELVKCQVRGSTDLWMPCLLPAGHDGGCDPWVDYTTAPPLLSEQVPGSAAPLSCDCEPTVYDDGSVGHEDDCEVFPWCPHEVVAYACPMPCRCSCAPCKALSEANRAN